MRRPLAVISIFATCALAGARLPEPAPAAAEAAPASSYRSDVVLVKLAPAAAGAIAAQAGGRLTFAAAAAAVGPSLADRGMSLAPSAVSVPWARVRIPGGMTVDAALAALRADPRYEIVQPVFVYRILRTPNDSTYGSQWHLNNTGQISVGTSTFPDQDIDAPEAWDLFTGSVTIEVAVLDTGIDSDHADFAGRLHVVAGSDIVDGDDVPEHDGGLDHGTQVAGLMAAETNNSLNVAGVLWAGDVVPIRVCDENGACDNDDVSAGIDLARMTGCSVVNMSLGYEFTEGTDTVFDAAVRNASDAGLIVVSAAGNGGNRYLASYPAAHGRSMGIGSVYVNGAVSSFSQTGSEIDLSAYGEDLISLGDGGGEDWYIDGTSFSAPLVAAAAALARGARTGADTESVQRWLRATATNARADGWSYSVGAGILNLRRLLEVATSNPAYDGTATGATLFDSFTNATEAAAAVGVGYDAGGRNGGPAASLDAASRLNYTAAQTPDTGTVELYWKPRFLPAAGAPSAVIDAGTLALALEADGRLALRVGGDEIRSTTSVRADQWYHLAVTYTETEAALWVNGVAEATDSVVASIAGEDLDLGTAAGVAAAGLYDQLRLSNVARQVFPAALELRVPPSTLATNMARGGIASWWCLSSETRPVRITLGADRDRSGYDGVVLATATEDDMREKVNLSSLSAGVDYYLWAAASDGVDVVAAYAEAPFRLPSVLPPEAQPGGNPSGQLTALPADGARNGECILERLGAPAAFASALRRVRDALAATAAGRLLARLYYLL